MSVWLKLINKALLFPNFNDKKFFESNISYYETKQISIKYLDLKKSDFLQYMVFCLKEDFEKENKKFNNKNHLM